MSPAQTQPRVLAARWSRVTTERSGACRAGLAGRGLPGGLAGRVGQEIARALG